MKQKNDQTIKAHIPAKQKKVCMLGEFSVGKTSLVRQFVEGQFSDKYLSTVGAKVSRRKVAVEVGGQAQEAVLLIWDLVGGEKFDRVMENYYRGSAGAILVCDLTRRETLTALSDYADNFWGVRPQVPLVLVGNKVDLSDQIVISDDELTQLAEQLGSKFFLSSAKTGQNVEDIFNFLAERVLVTG